MKTRSSPARASAGNVLVISLVIGGVMGLILVSYLTMIGTQETVTARSQAWNSCIAIAEAGVEEALAHLNKNGIAQTGTTTALDLATNDWTAAGVDYYKQAELGDGYYEVYIKTGSRPVITSTGFLPAPTATASSGGFFLAKAGNKIDLARGYVSRTVQVQCRAVGRFTKAIVAKDRVELNGKDVSVDSFHSYDPAASTYDPTNAALWGLYDITKRQDHGDVAVVEGFSDTMEIKSAKVRGKVATGPNGDLRTNSTAVVGSLAWHEAGNLGVQPGWSTTDANFDMPSVAKPFNSGMAPTGGLVGTNYYDYILGDGDYKLGKLKGAVLVTGNARLLVTSEIEFEDDPQIDDGIEFQPVGRLEVYMEGQEAHLKGKKNRQNLTSLRMGFNTGGNATNFFYYGLNSNTRLYMKNMDDFTGIVYAPKAEITIRAGSLKYYRAEFFGSVQGWKVKLEKNATFHYDENIGTLSAESYVVESWKEI